MRPRSTTTARYHDGRLNPTQLKVTFFNCRYGPWQAAIGRNHPGRRPGAFEFRAHGELLQMTISDAPANLRE
jgi:hypothetical protein